MIYLVFKEGYAATRGEELLGTDLCMEAIGLGRLILDLLALQPPHDAVGLLALMLLHDARREARRDAEGNLVLLDAQDRGLWNRAQIQIEMALAVEAMDRNQDPLPCRRRSLPCTAVRLVRNRQTGAETPSDLPF